MTETTETTGQRLKRLRKARGLSRERLGAHCGLSGQTIRRYELGLTTPHPLFLEAIAGALGCEVADLYPAPTT